MKKTIIISIILNCVFAPAALLYFIRKVQFREDMKRDKANAVFVKKTANPNTALRESLFETMPAANSSIVFLGNSLIANCDWSEMFNRTIKNRGVSGETLDQITKRVDQLVKLNPKKIFVLAATNDMTGNANLDTITNKYARLLTKLKKDLPQSHVYVYSELPRNDFAPANRLVVPINEKLQQLAMAKGDTYIDIYKYFVDEDGGLKRKYTYDGLHVEGKGYVVWKNAIQKYIDDDANKYSASL